jgi:hypothetical protein
MVCDEKAEMAGKLSWIEAEPVEQDAPISVWWDDPPAGDDDDGYASLRAGIVGVNIRTSRT